MKRIWNCLRSAFARSFSLIVDCENEWSKIADDERNVRKNYLLPLVAVCCALAFVGSWMEGKPLNVICLRAVMWGIMFAFAITLSLWVSRFIVQKIYGVEIPDSLNDKIVGYSFTAILFIRMFLALAPNFFFVRIFALFTPYILKFAMDKLLPIDNVALRDERKYYLYLGINSLSIVCSPFLFELMLEKLVFQNVAF